MKMKDRVAGYRRTNLTNGLNGLTSKQDRRCWKKHHRDEKALKARQAEIVNEVMLKPGECPTCRATGDNPCTTKSGAKAKANHKGRAS